MNKSLRMKGKGTKVLLGKYPWDSVRENKAFGLLFFRSICTSLETTKSCFFCFECVCPLSSSVPSVKATSPPHRVLIELKNGISYFRDSENSSSSMSFKNTFLNMLHNPDLSTCRDRTKETL
jgi:hypothetical protein